MHIAMMIDLETLGLDQSALVLSAGICIGDLDSTDTGRYPQLTEEHFITPSSNRGRTVSVDTLEWWMKQLREGIALPSSPTAVDLKVLLERLHVLFISNMVDSVWSKGADFDIKILEHAYKQHGMPTPWTYRQVRCFRTVDALFADTVHDTIKQRTTEENLHGGLGDALYQYRLLHHYWDFVKAGQ